MPGTVRHSRKHLLFAGVLLVVAMAGAFLAGYLPRRTTVRQLDRAAAEFRRTPPHVNATAVTRAPKKTEVSFPGSVTPIIEAYIYARATG